MSNNGWDTYVKNDLTFISSPYGAARDLIGANFILDNGIVDPCVIDGKRYMGHETGWITVVPEFVSGNNCLTSITASSNILQYTQEDDEDDIDEILDLIEERIDVIDNKLTLMGERLSKLECRLGDSLGRIEQSIDQIVRQVYKTY